MCLCPLFYMDVISFFIRRVSLEISAYIEKKFMTD